METTIATSSPPEQSGRTSDIDVEKGGFHANDALLFNDVVQTLTWEDVTVTVEDRKTKQTKKLLDNVHGCVKAGELLALLGPSGSGKSTLLNTLARRTPGALSTTGTVHLNGWHPSNSTFRRLSSYVEQEDALLGSLTVRETLSFAARLSSSPSSASSTDGNGRVATRQEREARIEGLMASFGLLGQRDTLVGTPLLSGLSGGQKRRLSIASQLLTSPRVLFLDEPTSGLDSAASWEVISFLRRVARRNRLIVVMSIHQPSSKVFNLFDRVMCLARGKLCYAGPTQQIGAFMGRAGVAVPWGINPAEVVLDVLNTDFNSSHSRTTGSSSSSSSPEPSGEGPTRDDVQLERVIAEWEGSQLKRDLMAEISAAAANGGRGDDGDCDSDFGMRRGGRGELGRFWGVVGALVQRLWIKGRRDIFAYWVRVAMYICLAILMGTVWLRLGSDQKYIQPHINAIFFGAAFISFMAVSYVPAFLEDRSVYIKEGLHNGQYSALAFQVSNFIIGVPFLFLISLSFSVIAYWLVNFNPTAKAFWTFLMWLFLDLLAAESLVVLVTGLLPNGVLALAVIAFSNGLWMCVGGFLVPPTILNVFYKYVFHYIDYQAYVFSGMMVNQFEGVTYDCDANCHCLFDTGLASQCKVDGLGVLDQYGYVTGQTWLWVVILLGIIVGYRVLAWGTLVLRR